VGCALLALSRDKRRLAATLLLAIAGTTLLSVVLTAIFGHARPTNALVAAHEASFPSGHMLSSAVIYGLFASRLLRSSLRRTARAFGAALLLLLVTGIGLSRLYLGVHWPSDLLASLTLALVGALGLLLGERASGDLIRTGAEKATVEGVCDVAKLKGIAELADQRGVEVEDDTLVLRREIGVNGRGRAWINGATVTATTLAEIGRRLVNLHGQHDAQSLLDGESQRAILDAFGGAEPQAATALSAILDPRDWTLTILV